MRGVLLDLDAFVDPEGRWSHVALAWGREHLLAWWEVARSDPSARLAVADMQRSLRRAEAEPEAALKQAIRRLSEPWAPSSLVAVAGASAVFGMERGALAPPSMVAVRDALSRWRRERRRVAIVTRWPACLAMGALRLDTPRLDDAVHLVLDPRAGHADEPATYRAARRHPALRGVALTFASGLAPALEAATRGGLATVSMAGLDAASALRSWSPDDVFYG